ncbi:uncharacterized protein [Arachis hypogaea]|uniref:uncharacterized protein isoform X1 n=1 Tax=Arachis hypogaea TaxID=3818 RepID=UPI0034E8112A
MLEVLRVSAYAFSLSHPVSASQFTEYTLHQFSHSLQGSLLGQYSFAAQAPDSFYHLDQSWVMVQEIEILKIEVMPGWRKGTKIKFEGKGDEKPGYLPAEIPLVDALTGCSLPIPILGGEKLTLSFENTVVYPGYVKVIEAQGMPTLKNDGKRGDLHVKFLVDFPKELSDEQRQEAFRSSLVGNSFQFLFMAHLS